MPADPETSHTVAAQLHLSLHKVKTHVHNAFAKAVAITRPPRRHR